MQNFPILAWPKMVLKEMTHTFQLESWAHKAMRPQNTSWQVNNFTQKVKKNNDTWLTWTLIWFIASSILTCVHFFLLHIGHLTAMSDVYSFGVVLLELLTGRRSVDKGRPQREQNLVEWARSALNDSRKLSRIMDPRLEGQYSEVGARKAAALAYQCLSHRPRSRPLMSTVVNVLEPLQDFDDVPIGPFVYTVPAEQQQYNEVAKESETPKERKRENGHHHNRRHHHHRHNGHRHHPLKSPKTPMPSDQSQNDEHRNGRKSGSNSPDTFNASEAQRSMG